MLKNNIFISHASEDKEILVNPFVDCLEEHGITNYWYDKDQIETGDLIVKRINQGLSTSKIGIIIFSKKYLQKDWSMWELMVILTLLITHKIRMLPFMSGDITYEQIIERYPILAPLRFEPIPCCDKIVSIVRRKLEESCELLDNPSSSFAIEDRQINSSDYENASYENSDTARSESMKKVDEKKLSESYQDLKDSNIPEVREMAITKLQTILKKKIYGTSTSRGKL